MSVIIPPYLQPGDTIGITCPAGFVSHERIAYALEVLQRWGFKVRLGQTIGERDTYFSGSDAERRNELQSMLDDPEIKAIISGRGGYGTSRIIDDLDFSIFSKQPKWLCGFSDITVLHSHIYTNHNVATIHGPMCSAFNIESEPTEYIQSLRKALTGQDLTHTLPPSIFNRNGKITAPIVGGNLAMLGHLTGSVSQLNTNGKILFIEDIGEHLYHIDRLLLNLKRSGQLSGIAALLVGTFTDCEDTDRPFGQTLEEIIYSKVAEYDFPVAFNLPVGHGKENLAIRHGMEYELIVSDNNCVLSVVPIVEQMPV